MYEYITIIIVSVWITISLIYGGLLWMKRKEVPDRSRTYLSVLCFLTTIGISNYIVAAIRHDVADYSHQLLQPELTIGGLWAISMFVCYPIEVMRPRGLRGWWLALLFLPSLLATLPAVFGMHFQALHSCAAPAVPCHADFYVPDTALHTIQLAQVECRLPMDS